MEATVSTNRSSVQSFLAIGSIGKPYNKWKLAAISKPSASAARTSKMPTIRASLVAAIAASLASRSAAATLLRVPRRAARADTRRRTDNVLTGRPACDGLCSERHCTEKSPTSLPSFPGSTGFPDRHRSRSPEVHVKRLWVLGSGGRWGQVPPADHRVLVLVAQHAERRGLQRIVPASSGGLVQPASREHAQDMSVREDQDVACDLPYLRDHRVNPATDVGRRLAIGAAITPEGPAGVLLGDLPRGPTLVPAVIPLHQLRSHLCRRSITRQAARLQRAPQWAAEDQRKVPGAEGLRERRRLPLALRGERDIGSARMTTVSTRFGFAVADEHHVAGHADVLSRYGSR